MKITCPFCYAQIIVETIPPKCPHCGAKFKKEDDFQPKLTQYEFFKKTSTTFRS